MEVFLKVLVGKNAGHEIPVTAAKFFIGRAEDCQLRPRSDLISRHHCALLVEGDAVTLQDFGSKNGSYVNGERVAGEEVLADGDQLRVGPLEFEVVLRTPAPAKKFPKVHSIEEAASRAAQRRGDDLDIDQWLVAADPSAPTANLPPPDAGATSATDTRQLSAADTEQIRFATLGTPGAADTPRRVSCPRSSTARRTAAKPPRTC
jgi:predicted component of type VI protein secretion system